MAILILGIAIRLMSDNDVHIDKSFSQEKEVIEFDPVVDWRGFTEQDFENMQVNKMYDVNYGYNHDFYAGDLLLCVKHAVHTVNLIDIMPHIMKDGCTPNAELKEMLGCGMQYEINELRKMTYSEFQDEVSIHLKNLVTKSKMLLPREKTVLAEAINKPIPESWAYEDFKQKLQLAKELVRNGETLANFEKKYIISDKRQNLLLHGGNKQLMKKLKKELEKDKEIKKILSAPSR